MHRFIKLPASRNFDSFSLAVGLAGLLFFLLPWSAFAQEQGDTPCMKLDKLETSYSRLNPGGSMDAHLTFRSSRCGMPDQAAADSGQVTELLLQSIPGVTATVRQFSYTRDRIDRPLGATIQATLDIKVLSNTVPGEYKIPAVLKYRAMNASQQLVDESVPLVIPIEIAALNVAATTEPCLKLRKVFTSYDALWQGGGMTVKLTFDGDGCVVPQLQGSPDSSRVTIQVQPVEGLASKKSFISFNKFEHQERVAREVVATIYLSASPNQPPGDYSIPVTMTYRARDRQGNPLDQSLMVKVPIKVVADSTQVKMHNEGNYQVLLTVLVIVLLPVILPVYVACLILGVPVTD